MAQSRSFEVESGSATQPPLTLVSSHDFEIWSFVKVVWDIFDNSTDFKPFHPMKTKLKAKLIERIGAQILCSAYFTSYQFILEKGV